MGHCNTKKKQKRKRVKSNKRKRRRTQKGGSIFTRISSGFQSLLPRNPFGSSTSTSTDTKPQEQQPVSPQVEASAKSPEKPTVDGIIALIKQQSSNNNKIIEEINQIKETLNPEDIAKLKKVINENKNDLITKIKRDSALAQKLEIDATSDQEESPPPPPETPSGLPAPGTPSGLPAPGTPSGPPPAGTAPETAPASGAQGGKGSRKKKKKSRKKK